MSLVLEFRFPFYNIELFAFLEKKMYVALITFNADSEVLLLLTLL